MLTCALWCVIVTLVQWRHSRGRWRHHIFYTSWSSRSAIRPRALCCLYLQMCIMNIPKLKEWRTNMIHGAAMKLLPPPPTPEKNAPIHFFFIFIYSSILKNKDIFPEDILVRIGIAIWVSYMGTACLPPSPLVEG